MQLSQDERADLMNELVDLARSAGSQILEIYAQDFRVETKSDDSPVTEADRRAEEVILEGLAELLPSVPVVAEESADRGEVPRVGDGPFFLVDPLDGTRQFVDRNGEFTVNIGLIEGGRPTLGVIHLPAMNETYWTDGRGGAHRRLRGGNVEAIACRPAGPGGLRVVASRSHQNEETRRYLRSLSIKALVTSGSSLKFCRLAEGAADLYPRLGRTMEWDVAAGHALLVAAGGSVTLLDGRPFGYAKPGFENPHFLARGLPAD